MLRLGLALSGGGFRATLYHLGVIRFLRDAGVLPQITHITTVSGGSILGAHLALNWAKYCGSDDEFDAISQEIIRFTQMDVRNRIVRRFLFCAGANTARRFMRMSRSRQWTRAGLLEKHYEQFLFGDVALSQLPDRPQLHILATNLSEGCLCSFHRRGLLMQRRVQGRRDQFEMVHLGLATVPMAVACSSAFPGFFPPMELNGWDVGADAEAFKQHLFTDGGVYDNLGLRMFRCMEQIATRDVVPLRREDFLELKASTAALESAGSLPEDTPLRRLRERLDRHRSRSSRSSSEEETTALIRGLWDVIRTDRVYRDPCFHQMELADPGAQSLLHYVVESGREPELSDRLWLNRQIVEASLRQVIGKPCLRPGRKEFDGVLVSDAGGKFKVNRSARAAGLIRTALRASDILMDRVWQLENEAFENAPGILFFPIFDVVEPSHDGTAPDPEVQRQAARTRTDLDRFSDLEVTALVQHGYCVARKAFHVNQSRLSVDIPDGPPWNPLAGDDGGPGASRASCDLSDVRTALPLARRLQKSSRRRIWSTLLSLRDWPSYVWVALVIGLAIGVPWGLYRLKQQSDRQATVLAAVADMSPDYRRILSMLETEPVGPPETLPFVDVESLAEPDYTGFDVLVDTRIFDLRAWSTTDEHVFATSHARLRILRTGEGDSDGYLRLQRESSDDAVGTWCHSQRLNPRLLRTKTTDGTWMYELNLDFSHVPVGSEAELHLHRLLTTDMAHQTPDGGHLNFTVSTKTGLLDVWLLMPSERSYESLQVSGYPLGNPELAKLVVPHSLVRSPYGSIVTYRLINPEAFRYECNWTWGD